MHLHCLGETLRIMQCFSPHPQPDLQQKKGSLKQKQQHISEMLSEIQQKEVHKDDIIQKIEKLKEEHAKRKACKTMLEITVVSQKLKHFSTRPLFSHVFESV